MNRLRKMMDNRNGAVMPLMIFLFPVILIFCGIAINWAQLQLVKTELQVATDASCRAANRAFAVSGNMTTARSIAQSVANKNIVGDKALTLQSANFQRGVVTRPDVNSRYSFTVRNSGANAIRLVTAKNASVPSGPVKLYFPMLGGGISTASLQAEAISGSMEVDIALVLDRSGSMAYGINEVCDPTRYPIYAPPGWDYGQPVPPASRWLDTVDAVNIFLNELTLYPQRKQVSLSTYGTDSTLEQDLTYNHSLIPLRMATYTNAYPVGATNIGSGLITGNNNLVLSPNARTFANKVIILVTDGIHNWGPDPISIASTISGDGVTIFTVTVSDEANQNDMKTIAEVGGGFHVHAVSNAQLRQAFRKIAREIPAMIVK